MFFFVFSSVLTIFGQSTCASATDSNFKYFAMALLPMSSHFTYNVCFSFLIKQIHIESIRLIMNSIFLSFHFGYICCVLLCESEYYRTEQAFICICTERVICHYTNKNTDEHIVISYVDLLPHFYTQLHLTMTITKRNEIDSCSLLTLREISCAFLHFEIPNFQRQLFKNEFSIHS